jgi:superfamily II DNA or RNA helicase
VTEPLEQLFEAVRQACSPGVWSRGVELARAGAVSGEREADGEVVLRVETRAGLLGPTAVLHPGDVEWDCDCAGRDEVCEHVAAAVIALRQARRSGQALPGADADVGRIGYRLARAGDGLAFERVVVTAGEEWPLTSTLEAVRSGRVAGPRFLATREDVEVERALGTRLRGVLPRGLWPRLLAALARCPDLRLDGEPVCARIEPAGFVGVLEDRDGGFRLRVQRDPRVREVLGGGLALRGDALCPLAESGLTGRELEELTRGRDFEPDAAAQLVSEILPDLRRRIPVEVRTQRLPETSARERPRLRIEARREGDALSVLPTLVYGDPPLARVDAGRLVALAGRVPLRDEAAERALLRRLQSQLELAPGHRLRVEGERAVALAERLAHFGGDVHGRGLEHFRRVPALEARLHAGPGRFELAFASGGDPARGADPARVLRAWRAGEGLVPVAGGGFAELPADWLERFGDRVAQLLAAREADGGLPRLALPDLARLCEELGEPVPPDAAALRALIDHSGDAPPAALPAPAAGFLRGYQRSGASWLVRLREAGLGALLADDMGLGKTLQALCALRGRCLVVTPTSVLHNWASEAARFRPDLRCALYHGPDRRLDPGADLTLTTYALLRLDADALADVAWDAVVLDEAQAIKNPDSQAARAAFRLRAGFRLALTGTPVENRLDELWSQLHFAARGLLGSRGDFDERFARPIAAGDADAAARLRARIRPFVLRRTKAEVTPELPPRTEMVLRAELGPAERAVYDAVRAATREEVTRRLAAGGGVMQALEALLRLRQAACHAALVPGQRAESSAKLELLLEVLDQSAAEGHRALVFSQWTSLLDLVEPALRRAGLDFGRLDGATRDRAGVVARFQAPGGPPVLLLSLKAGGVGLNLTAADAVFILDPWWNPAVEDQAADRAHRIGQQRPVAIYRLVAADTVEERILALQERKRSLAAAALAESGGAAALSREDLIALLE